MDFLRTASIVWPVYYRGLVPDAHVTMVFLGEIVGQEGKFASVISALDEHVFGDYGEACVLGPQLFGDPTNPVIVLELEDIEGFGLSEIRSSVLESLNDHGIEDASSYPDYRPHMTVGKELPVPIPESLVLHYPELWWGKHRLSLRDLGI